VSDYIISITSRSEREARIRKGTKIDEETLYDFRNQPAKLPVIQLPIDLPIYRMENFRTFTDQSRILAERKLAPDYFTGGQESEAAQQVQHDLLAELAREGVANSVVPVIDVLSEVGQREPILISSSGVVVNGNRRLAAMRELYAADKKGKTGFGTVNCAVLPDDTSADEVLNIEASLQAQPDTKLDYDWIGDAQLVKKLSERQSTLIVAERLRRSEREIRNTIQALLEADLYLKEWVKAPSEYSRVTEDGEQFFKDLPKQLEANEEALKTPSRILAWTLFDNRGLVPGRVYLFNPAFGRLAKVVLTQIANDLKVSTTPGDTALGDDFDVDIDEPSGPVSFDNVAEVLRNSKGNRDVADIVIEASQAAIDIDKGQKSGGAALKLIAQAHTKLASVNISTAAADTRPRILKQLESIKNLVSALETKLAQIKK
jgi:hypothetical protein